MERDAGRPGRYQKPQKRTSGSANQNLLILIGVLSAVLVILLVICGTLFNGERPDPSDPVLNSSTQSDPSQSSSSSTGSSGAASQPSSSVPQTSVPPVTSIPATTAPKLPTTPSSGNYINVGSGYVAEVVQTNVETFDGKTNDDYSRPTNNYLPEGTVDYCDRDLVYNASTKYVLLRSGHRVYVEKKIYPPVRIEPEVKQYEMVLPDHNEIGVVSLETVGHHTILTLDCLWKAPFYFETNQSGYANPNGGSSRDYAVSSNNATYVDITFCYATSFTGNVSIPGNHPLFKSAEIIRNDADYTLRLYLRKAGSLYGWHAYYNDNDQLCFKFLNPTKVTAADNKYGADLTGAVVMIDVGHGGLDGGAVGTDANGKKWEEAELNLSLAQALKAELESIGATVIMNRSGDTSIDINTRLEDLMDTAPDICIAIHQNSYTSASVSGFDSMYFTPWSQLLAKQVYNYTKESGVYKKNHLKWSVNYFMMRQTVCPVILTENGYVSNAADLNAMIDENSIQSKAQAIAHGTAAYFLAIQ